MPTIPEDGGRHDGAMAAGWSLSAIQSDSAELIQSNTPELSLAELVRLPAVLPEDTTLSTAAELLASGMNGPIVIVTSDNKPLGILNSTHVLQLVKDHGFEELQSISLLEVAVPCGMFLEETATPLEAAARFMASDCDALVVVKRDGELAGVLLARDLCQLWL